MRWPQPYLIKRGNRFNYRRRVAWRGMVTEPITIPLGTTDPALARFLAQRLTGKWNEIVDIVWNDKALTASQRIALMRQSVDREIGFATRDWFIRAPRPEEATMHRFHAVAYEFARTIPLCKAAPGKHLDLELMRVPKGCAPGIIEEFPDDYHSGKYQRTLSDEEVAMAIKLLTDGSFAELPEEARHVIWRGKAEARLRLAYAIETGSTDQPEYIEQLLEDKDISDRAWKAAFGDSRPFKGYFDEPPRNEKTPPKSEADLTQVEAARHSQGGAVAKDLNQPCPYIERDTRRFSEQIDRIVADQLSAGNWARDEKQARRVLNAFAWITGDKETHAYRPSDITHFADVISGLPKTFRWEGRFEACAPSYEEIKHTLPVADETTQRSNRTINRDLTILSAAAKILAKDSWKAPYDNQIMNFGSSRKETDEWEDDEDDDRVPWTERHVRALFNLPLFTGCRGAVKRLRPGNAVFQDGAFWLPALIAYSALSREEGSGIELDEIFLDEPVPFIVIQRNMTKSIDDKKPAGLKNRHRKRLMPIHPELLRLGFGDYVRARRKEGGHPALFPELYVPKFGGPPYAKRGGTRFYARSGQHILNAVDSIEPLPRTEKGDRADFHSIRTYVCSLLSFSETKDWIVKDLMGHARVGTTDKKYNKPEEVVGRDEYLARLRQALVDVLPIVTSHLAHQSVNILPFEQRSRTGSPPR